MKNMPKEIKSLYFPLVVMPEKEMLCYRAELINEKLAIEIENIKINDGGKYNDRNIRYSLMALKVMDKIRNQQDIVFPADLK